MSRYKDLYKKGYHKYDNKYLMDPDSLMKLVSQRIHPMNTKITVQKRVSITKKNFQEIINDLLNEYQIEKLAEKLTKEMNNIINNILSNFFMVLPFFIGEYEKNSVSYLIVYFDINVYYIKFIIAYNLS